MTPVEVGQWRWLSPAADREDALAGEWVPVLVRSVGEARVDVESEGGRVGFVTPDRVGAECCEIEFLPETWRRMAARAEQVRRRSTCSS